MLQTIDKVELDGITIIEYNEKCTNKHWKGKVLLNVLGVIMKRVTLVRIVVTSARISYKGIVISTNQLVSCQN